MHQVVNATPVGMITDHIDHDGLNNDCQNLRTVTRAQNSFNSLKKRLATSRFKGVYRNQRGTWHATIGVNGKTLSLGYFEIEVDAAKAYNLAAIRYFGEYAVLNNIKQNI